MNYSNYKKISQDQKITTMQHPDGHQIRIVHSALSPQLRERLGKIPVHRASGGEVDDFDVNAPAQPVSGSEARDVSRQNLGIPTKIIQKMDQYPVPTHQISYPPPIKQDYDTPPQKIDKMPLAEGGQVKPKVEQDYSQVPLKENKMGGAPQQPEINQPVKYSNFNPQEPVMRAGGGGADNSPLTPEEQADADAPATPVTGKEAKAQSDKNLNISPKTQAAIDATPLDAPVANRAPSTVTPGDVDQSQIPPGQQVANQTAPAAVAMSNDPYGAQQALQAQINALGEIKKGQLQENAQNSLLGGREGQMGGLQATAQQQQLLQYNQAFQALQKEREGVFADVQNGHIDPNEYINNMSTGKTIATGIGLLLGGMGSGLTHQPNLAFESLQNNINRDIDAQRLNLGAKESLLSNNLQQTGNLNTAMQLTNLQTNQIFAAKFKQIADYGTQSMESAKANQIAGLFDQKAADLQHQMAVQQAMLGPTAQNQDPEAAFANRMQYLRMQGPEGEKMAQQQEAHHIPGFTGMTARPVQKSDTDQWSNLTNLQKLINNAQTYSNQVGTWGAGYLRGNPAVAAQGRSLESALTLEMGKFADLNRFTPEEHKLFVQRVPSLTGTDITGQRQALLNQLQQEISNKVDTFKSSLFGPGAVKQKAPGLSGEDQEALFWARKNSNDPRSAKILKKLGVK